MNKFIESLCLKDGGVRHLEHHQRRLDLTLLAHFGRAAQINLADALGQCELPQVGLHKIRVTYANTLVAIEIDPYVPRKLARLQLIELNELDYRFKYADRHVFAQLEKAYAPSDAIGIVQAGLVTDSTYANLCFFDGARWLTPRRPLLYGVARGLAVAAGEVVEADIFAEDVTAGKYVQIKLINCMNSFGDAAVINL